MNLHIFINVSGKLNRNDFSLLTWSWNAYKLSDKSINFNTFKSRIAYTLLTA